MKYLNYILSIFCIIVLLSCSKDEDIEPIPEEKISHIMATIGGSSKMYNNITLTPIGSTLYDITATVNNNVNDAITFTCNYNTGTNAVNSFNLYLNLADPDYYSNNLGNLVINVATNNSELIQGTFTGTLEKVSDLTPITITNGTFKIYK